MTDHLCPKCGTEAEAKGAIWACPACKYRWEEVEIVKVPIASGRGRRPAYPWLSLEVGKSFFVPGPSRSFGGRVKYWNDRCRDRRIEMGDDVSRRFCVSSRNKDGSHVRGLNKENVEVDGFLVTRVQ